MVSREEEMFLTLVFEEGNGVLESFGKGNGGLPAENTLGLAFRNTWDVGVCHENIAPKSSSRSVLYN